MSKVLQLYGGRLVDPKNLKLEDIDIEAIAHSLSNQCRFLGHSMWHYSVAQHSVYVSRLAPLLYKKCALLHDAPESILVDVPSLMKQQNIFDAYRLLEKIVWAVTARRYRLPNRMPGIIKRIDKAVLWYEANTLMRNRNGTLNTHWYSYKIYATEFTPLVIEKWTPEQAKEMFLKTYEEINVSQQK